MLWLQLTGIRSLNQARASLSSSRYRRNLSLYQACGNRFKLNPSDVTPFKATSKHVEVALATGYSLFVLRFRIKYATSPQQTMG